MWRGGTTQGLVCTRQLGCRQHNPAPLVSIPVSCSLNSSNSASSLPLPPLESLPPKWLQANWTGHSFQMSWGPQSRGQPKARWRPCRCRVQRSSPPGWGSADQRGGQSSQAAQEKYKVKHKGTLNANRFTGRRSESEIWVFSESLIVTWTTMMLISNKRSPCGAHVSPPTSPTACTENLTCLPRGLCRKTEHDCLQIGAN